MSYRVHIPFVLSIQAMIINDVCLNPKCPDFAEVYLAAYLFPPASTDVCLKETTWWWLRRKFSPGHGSCRVQAKSHTRTRKDPVHQTM